MSNELLAQLCESGVFSMPAKVYKKSKDRWYVQLYWKGQQHRRFMFDQHTPFVHEKLAEIVADAINTDIKKKGKYFDPRQWFALKGHELQFDQYAEKWLEAQENLASYPDIKSYVTRWIVPFFGSTDIREVRKGQIKDFMQELLKHYSPKTVKNILGHLHKMFRDAFDDELILRVPPFPTVTITEPELTYISQEKVYSIISQISERDQPIFRFGYFYAMRPGEVRALQWDCIDWDKGTVTVKRTFSGYQLREHTKTKLIRVLPLMDEVALILRPIRGISGYVFRTVQGKPYRKQRLGELWRQAGGSVPLYNGMRHSRAMHLLENEKWDLEYVRSLLGHTRSEMTRRYARASAEGLRKRYGDSNLSENLSSPRHLSTPSRNQE